MLVFKKKKLKYVTDPELKISKREMSGYQLLSGEDTYVGWLTHCSCK